MILKRLLLLFCLTAVSLGASAQKLGIRTSGTMLATCTPNVELNYVINNHFTAHLPVLYNPFVFGNNSRFQQLTVMPGARYWFKTAHAQYFASAFAIASRFHVGGWLDHGYRYNGNCYGVGLGGGYSWILSKRFNLDCEAGVGFTYADYDKCAWPKHSKLYSSEKGLRVFPAKIDVSIVYFF